MDAPVIKTPETRWPQMAGGMVMFISVSVMVGWITGVQPLVKWVPGEARQVMNAALCLFLASAGFVALDLGHKRWAAACGAIVAAFCLVVLAQFVLGVSLGVDGLFWHHQWASPLNPPGRMSANSAIALGLTGGALVQLALGRHWRWPLAVMGGVVAAFAFLPVMLYASSVVLGNEGVPYQGMSMPTAVCLLLLGSIVLNEIRTAADGEAMALPFMAAALGMLISVGVVAVQSNASLINANDRVVQTYAVRGDVDRFVEEVARMESSTRAYALTSEDYFRERAEVHQKEILHRLDELQSLVAENPAQVTRVARLRVLTTEKFTQDAELTRERREHGGDAAARYLMKLLAQPGRPTSELVVLADEMRAEENRLLVEREQARAGVERNARIVEVIGSLLVLALLGTAVAVAQRAAATQRAAEAAMRASRERLALIFGSVAEGIVFQNARGEIEECNAATERILGLTRDQLMKRTAFDPMWRVIHENGEPWAPAEHPTVLTSQTGQSQKDVVMGVHKADGSLAWVIVNTDAVRTPDGRIGAVVASFADITARRQAESALRESEDRFRRAFEDAGIGMALVGLDGHWLRVNRAICEIVGYSEVELLQKSFQEITHPDDLKNDLASVGALLAGRLRSYHMEKRYLHREGRVVWINLTVSLLRDTEGRPLHFVSQIEDITARKAAQQALHQSQEMFQRLFESSPDAVVLAGRDGKIVRANLRAEALFGWPAHELAGQSIDVLMPERFRGPHTLHLAEFFRNPHARPMGAGLELFGCRKDGVEFPVDIVLSPVEIEEGSAALAVVRDITARKRLESDLRTARDQAVETSRLKSEFLATMSHELRTPMNGVIGMLGLLVDTPLDEEQREITRIIQTSANGLLAIINETLDLSKIEAGKLRIELAEFDLRELIEETLALLTPRAHEKHLELTADVTAAASGVVRGDAGRIRQVLTNLIGNAIKFTPKGRVGVRVSVAAASAERLTVHVAVEDTGIGIPPEAHSRLFQPFTQVDGSSTRRFGGTGLGLAISRQLVLLMGGEIGFSSEFGRGSTFWFELSLARGAVPVRPPPELARRALDASGPTPTSAIPVSPRKLRLLVAEDNPANQTVSRMLLEKMGHSADIAGDGQLALEQLGRARYDAVLMDCHMPVLNGYDATRRIRAGAVPGVDRQIPVIALTAYAMADDREKCLAAGMSDYLTKPVSATELQLALQRCGLLAREEENPVVPIESMEPGNGVLNMELVQMVRGLPGRKGPSLWEELLVLFRTEEPVRLAELEQKIAVREASEVAAVAHRLAGSCGSFGAVEMRMMALALEQAARDGRWEEVSADLRDLRAASSRLHQALNSL